MNSSIYNISFTSIAMIMSLVAVVAIIYIRWSLNAVTVVYAALRMVLQLTLVGYCLIYIFDHQSSWLVILLLSVMLGVASWIALRPIKENRRHLYFQALLAMFCGGVLTLSIVVGLILPLQPWYEARYVIPLAGMIFSNAMNAVSLSAERFESELAQGKDFETARRIAYEASLIPITNSLFAVGIVALPGMMTGQILSGISPLIAVRYQIMVMCMVFGANGITSAVYLTLMKKEYETRKAA